MEFVAPLEHRAMFRNQCKRPLLQLEPGAFLDPHFGPIGSSTESGEYSHVRIEPHPVIAPVPGRDHPPVKVQDASKFHPVECRNRPPVPRMRKRRNDAQALFTFGTG